MAKITEIIFPARVASSYGSDKRAILNPVAHLQWFASYELAKPENGFINNAEATRKYKKY